MSLVQGTMLFAAELTWGGRGGIEGEYQRAINFIARSALGALPRASLQQRAVSPRHEPSLIVDRPDLPSVCSPGHRTEAVQRRSLRGIQQSV